MIAFVDHAERPLASRSQEAAGVKGAAKVTGLSGDQLDGANVTRVTRDLHVGK